jgi:hypothetical protein
MDVVRFKVTGKTIKIEVRTWTYFILIVLWICCLFA